MSEKALVLIDVEKGKAVSVASKLNGKPGIVKSGVFLNDHNVIAVIEANNTRSWDRIVHDEIEPVDSVIQSKPLLVFSGN